MAGRGCGQRGDNGWSEWGGYMAVSFSYESIFKEIFSHN
jgi:hypothetical protein